MLAVPLSACVAVIVDEMYVKDVLGDRDPAKHKQSEDLVAPEAPQESFAPEPS